MLSEEDRERYQAKFDSDVQWLRNNIPPDDIYDFSEQALMAADFFINELSLYVDLNEEAQINKLFGVWLKNIVGLRLLKNSNMNGRIEMNLKTEDEI